MTATATTSKTVIAIYRVQISQESKFMDLLRRHHQTLRGLDLVVDDAPIVYRGHEQDGGLIVFEIFTWKTTDAPQVAHQTPAVVQIWEAMGTITEARNGRPKFEFPHVEELDFS